MSIFDTVTADTVALAEFLDLADHHRAEMRQREAQSWEWGHIAGFEAGYHAAEQEMAQQWAALARSVRAQAARFKGNVREPVMQPQPRYPDSIWFTAEQWAAITGECTE
jgi:flagellar biosynthesis/type III secretory pathway protein FliH